MALHSWLNPEQRPDLAPNCPESHLLEAGAHAGLSWADTSHPPGPRDDMSPPFKETLCPSPDRESSHYGDSGLNGQSSICCIDPYSTPNSSTSPVRACPTWALWTAVPSAGALEHVGLDTQSEPQFPP